MTKAIIVVGAQWGDEGKGKVVDYLADAFDYTARFAGGHNAGHTVIHDNQRFILQLIPCGILRPGKHAAIGAGAVIDPAALLAEIDNLASMGLRVEGRLHVSSRAHVIFPYHRQMDKAAEKARGSGAIGTTARGIGPAYEDKIARRALRVQDVFYPERFAAKLEPLLEYHNFVLTQYYKCAAVPYRETLDAALALAPQLEPMVADVAARIQEARRRGDSLLFEGAQGALLDIDHGTYPYVTSSNCLAGAAAPGCGIGPQLLDYVLGIVKAYTTRVGTGPFPTELEDDTGATLAKRGNEFGSVTGRPRRCGWLDLPALKRSLQLNGVDGLCITKLDVLDGIGPIRICTEYTAAGMRLDLLPSGAEAVAECKPVYEEVPGWDQSTFGVKSFDDLPQNARAYLRRIEQLAGVPIAMVSTGPERDETILMHHPFH